MPSSPDAGGLLLPAFPDADLELEVWSPFACFFWIKDFVRLEMPARADLATVVAASGPDTIVRTDLQKSTPHVIASQCFDLAILSAGNTHLCSVPM